MDCVNCECTVKTMNNLEGAIKSLLMSSKRVNKMMDKEKAICADKKREEVEELKKNLPKGKPMKVVTDTAETDIGLDATEEPTMVDSTCGDARRQIHNKKIRAAESVDFDIPSLVYETSSNRSMRNQFIPTVISIPEQTRPSSMCYKSTTVSRMSTVTSAASTTKSKSSKVYLDETYIVERDGRSEILPLKVCLKQRRDGTLEVCFAFLNNNCDVVMNISMHIRNKKVQNVYFHEKELKPKE